MQPAQTAVTQTLEIRDSDLDLITNQDPAAIPIVIAWLSNPAASEVLLVSIIPFLVEFAEEQKNIESIVKEGAIPVLLYLLKRNFLTVKPLIDIIQLLTKIAMHRENIKQMADEKAIAILISFLKHGNAELSMASLNFLVSLATSKVARKEIAAAAAIFDLHDVCKDSSDQKFLKLAVKFIFNLVKNKDNRHLIEESKIINTLSLSVNDGKILRLLSKSLIKIDPSVYKLYPDFQGRSSASSNFYKKANKKDQPKKTSQRNLFKSPM